MQKELGRYLFSVFLEKRKIDRHLKKYPPKLEFLEFCKKSRDHPILNLATVIFPHSSPVLLLLIKLHLLVSANFVFAVNEVILKKRWIFFV